MIFRHRAQEMIDLVKMTTTAITKLLLIVLFATSPGCSNTQIEFKATAGKAVDFKNSGIQLRFDRDMYCTIFYQKNDRLLSLNHHEKRNSDSVPSFYVVANNTVLRNFRLDYASINCEEIRTEFGKGKRLTLNGVSSDSDEFELEKKLTVELYRDFPNTAIVYAEFKNVSASQDVELQAVFSNSYQLDASLVDPNSSPHDFYSFYGSAGRPSRQIEKLLPGDFDRENYMGRPFSLEGIKKGNGGIPIIDLWGREMGLGIGHIEPKWKNLYLPIKVQTDRKVFLAIKEIPNINLDVPTILRPGDSYKTVRTFVQVHGLDFYETVATYSELLRRQGVDMHTEPTENDYLPAWCSWNEYSTQAMASKKDVMLIEPILNRLPELKDMKIREIIFDAGWFNNQGDWLPNPDALSFPGGESELISAIEKIHQAGFKVKLWISFLTADPWSQVAKSHPEWMIQKPDGSFHLDRWSGYTMCPSLPEVQAYHKELAKRFVSKYGADGFKVDGMYVCPPCYNPEHKHKNPNESSEDYYKVFKAFYEAAKSLNSGTTIMAGPCGTISDFTSLPYISETIAADPKSYEAVRRKAKLYRALKGADTPYSSDYVDIEKGNLHFPTSFANAVGVGAVPQTFYGERPSDETMEIYKKWFAIYSDEMISQAEYLNLYDMHFDRPETHVFKKTVNNKDVFYFSFFADESEWHGRVVFRGLDRNKKYRVYDYVNEKELGMINGSTPEMELSFREYLLLKCFER